MARIHLFEFEDFAWYPDFIRKGQTDFLRMMMRVFDVFRAVLPKFKKAVEEADADTVVDLCSGGGGSMLLVHEYFAKHGLDVKVLLSDLYPNIEAFEWMKAQSGGRIDYIKEAIDAKSLPENLDGFVTIFNGFHHLQPEDAQGVLDAVIKKKLPIGIFEPLERTVFQFLLNTVALTILPFLFTPFIKPFRFDRLVFTYLIPLIPICTLWDGWVSVLRLYTPAAMLQMAQSADHATDYTWQAGKARHRFGVVTYLIGMPK